MKWGAADRLLNACALLLLPVMVARDSSAFAFGQFAILHVITTLGIGAVTSVVGSLIIQAGPGSGAWLVWRRRLLIGSPGLLAGLGAASLVMGYNNVPVILGLCAWGVGASLTEGHKIENLTAGRLKPSCVISGLQLAFVVTSLFLNIIEILSVSAAVTLAGASTLTLGLAVRTPEGRDSGLVPAPIPAGSARQFLALYVSSALPALLVPTLIAALAGPSVVAGFRVGQTIGGAANQPAQISQPLLLAALRGQTRRSLVAKTLAHVLLTLVLMCATLLFSQTWPTSFATAVFGESWYEAVPIVGIIVISMAFAQVATSLETALKAVGKVRVISTTKPILSIAVVPLFGWVLITWGVHESLWLLVGFNLLTLLLNLTLLKFYLRGLDHGSVG